MPSSCRLTATAERALIDAWQAGDMRARETLARAQLEYVAYLARSYAARLGADHYEELYSVGAVGLTRAMQRFDSALGTRLSTYCLPCIQGEMSNYVRRAKRQLSADSPTDQEELESPEPDPECAMLEAEARRENLAVAAAFLARCTPLEQSVVRAVLELGDTAAAGRQLGMSRDAIRRVYATVRGRMRNARRK